MSFYSFCSPELSSYIQPPLKPTWCTPFPCTYPHLVSTYSKSCVWCTKHSLLKTKLPARTHFLHRFFPWNRSSKFKQNIKHINVITLMGWGLHRGQTLYLIWHIIFIVTSRTAEYLLFFFEIKLNSRNINKLFRIYLKTRHINITE